MTDEQIIWMAQEAGCSNLGIDVGIIGYLKMFRRFAELVENRTLTNQKARWYQAGVEAERHDIAKMVENYCGAWDDKGQALVQMIRSRGD